MEEIKRRVRTEMRNIYRGPENAYGAMDYTGTGRITEADLMASVVFSRLPYDVADGKEFIKRENFFNEGAWPTTRSKRASSRNSCSSRKARSKTTTSR